MGAQHTPGPWFADFHNERQDGGRYTTMVLAKGHLVPIAAVPSGVEGYGREEGRANAQLIAAVPELLEALEYIIDQFAEGNDPRVDDDGDEVDPLENARAAIAKARGA